MVIVTPSCVVVKLHAQGTDTFAYVCLNRHSMQHYCKASLDTISTESEIGWMGGLSRLSQKKRCCQPSFDRVLEKFSIIRCRLLHEIKSRVRERGKQPGQGTR